MSSKCSCTPTLGHHEPVLVVFLGVRWWCCKGCGGVVDTNAEEVLNKLAQRQHVSEKLTK